MNELGEKDNGSTINPVQEVDQSGYYVKGQKALYSKNPGEIAEKIAQGLDIEIEFHGDVIEELKKCVADQNDEERTARIKNVFSISLNELYGSVRNTDFQENIQKTKELVDCLIEQYKESFYLLFTVDHEPSTILHSINVMVLALHVYQYIENNFPEYLSMGSMQEFALAALLHDTGKVYIEDIIKKTEKLTDSDWERIKKHPKDGCALLKKAGINSEKILNAALYHHRRFNKTGYPEIIEGDEVLPLTYLIGVIDSIEAIISKSRIHNANRESINMEKAFGILWEDMRSRGSILYPINMYQLAMGALTQEGNGVFGQS